MKDENFKKKLAVFLEDPAVAKFIAQIESTEKYGDILDALLKFSKKERKIDVNNIILNKVDAYLESKTPELAREIIPKKGKDYFTKEEIVGFLEAASPKKGKDYFTDQEVKDLISLIVPLSTPIKGRDYFTEEEIKAFLKKATPIKGKDYKDGAPGYTPIKGVDYFDGKDADINEILEKVNGIFKLPDLSVDSIVGLEDRVKSLVSKFKTTKLHGGGSSTLAQLTDVSLGTLSNNDVLKYNSTTGKWENGTGGGGSPVAVYDEGILLTSGVTSFDFVGAGVTATTVGNAVTVTIAGGGGVSGSGTLNKIPLWTPNGTTLGDSDFESSALTMTLLTKDLKVNGGVIQLGNNPTPSLNVQLINSSGNLTLGGGYLVPTAGGTGFTGYAVGDILYADSTTTLAKLPMSTTGKFLAANTGGVPSWESISGVVTSVGATSPITSSGGATPTISTSMATNKLIGRGTAGTGVMEEITLGTNLSFSGTTLNAASPTPAALTKVDDTNVTLTLGGSPSTALLNATSITVGWTGTLADGRIASAATWNAKQDALSGTGIVKSTAGTISYISGTSAQFVKGDGSLDSSTYLTANQSITLSGDVSGTGSTAITTTIGANKVTNSMLAQVATATFKGRTTAGTGNVEDLTATQATALLNNFVGDSGSGGTKGLVVAPAAGDAAANKFLNADGTWKTVTASASLVVGSSTITSGTGTNILYNNAGTLGEYTITGTGSEVAMSTNPTITAPTIATNILPQSSAVTIGITGTAFGDVFLASGKKIDWNAGNATLTHSAGLLTSNVDIVVPAEAYGATWNGSNEVPTKNDVFDAKKSTAGVGTSPTASQTDTITHGLGYIPSIIRIYGYGSFTSNAAATATTSSMGIYNSSGNRCVYQRYGAAITTTQAGLSSTTFAILLATGGGSYISGVIQNVTSTQFDIVWTETGTATAQVYMWEAE